MPEDDRLAKSQEDRRIPYGSRRSHRQAQQTGFQIHDGPHSVSKENPMVSHPWLGEIDGSRHPPNSDLIDGPEAHIRREGDAYDQANRKNPPSKTTSVAPSK